MEYPLQFRLFNRNERWVLDGRTGGWVSFWQRMGPCYNCLVMEGCKVPLTEKQVNYVARLARIRLDPESAAQMTVHLDAVLEYMTQLNELNTDDIQPTMHVVALSVPLRADEVRPSLPLGETLKNAPDVRDNMFEVPRIMDGGEH